jgi:ABC-type sugar transport system permease subunit
VTTAGPTTSAGVQKPRPAEPRRVSRDRISLRGWLTGAALLLPTLVMLLAVALYPVLRSIWMSFRNTTPILREDSFVGVTNFSQLLSDEGFRNAWLNTIWFTTASTLVETILGLAFALVLHRSFPGRGWVRAVVLIPWAIPTVVTSRMFGYLLDGQSGVVNYLLVQTGVIDTAINFTGDIRYAMGTIIMADVWKTTPFMALLILAALQSVPTSLHESAAIDGASTWRRFWSITMPMILPALLIASMLRALDAFRIFDLPYVLTGGGPADSTEVLSTLAYKTLFSGSQYGLGSATTVLMFMTEMAIAALFAIWISRRFKILEG